MMLRLCNARHIKSNDNGTDTQAVHRDELELVTLVKPANEKMEIDGGVHQEEFWHSDEDAVDVVHRLRANDGYARQLAEAGTAFAQDYLVKEVMMALCGQGGLGLLQSGISTQRNRTDV
eukprot:scaffold234202_cov17-Tisochrysis_lutea.AAC.1